MVKFIVERAASSADRVPSLASEEVLVKQGAVGADEACSVRAVAAVLAHAVGLQQGGIRWRLADTRFPRCSNLQHCLLCAI